MCEAVVDETPVAAGLHPAMAGTAEDGGPVSRLFAQGRKVGPALAG